MPKRTGRNLIIITAVLFIFVLSGCGGRAASVAVATATAGSRDVEMALEFSGDLVPAQTANISSKISGQVISLGFNTGSPVKKGDVLMQLDTGQINAQILQARASLESAQAAVRSAENQASIAKVNLDAAQKAFDRTKQLFEAGAKSQSELDSDRDQLDIAARQYQTASGPGLDQARAAVGSASANLKNLNVQLDNSTVASPLDGVVSSQNVSVGEVVSPGVSVISIVDASSLKLRSTVSQDNLDLVKPGQTVVVTVGGRSVKYTGTVSTVGPIALNTGEVFPLEISIKNDGSLMAGMAARAALSTRVGGIMVPASAVVQDNGQNYVFVIKDRVSGKRAVKTGLRSGSYIQVLQGLQAGEELAVSNVRALADHMRVDIRN